MVNSHTHAFSGDPSSAHHLAKYLSNKLLSDNSLSNTCTCTWCVFLQAAPAVQHTSYMHVLALLAHSSSHNPVYPWVAHDNSGCSQLLKGSFVFIFFCSIFLGHGPWASYLLMVGAPACSYCACTGLLWLTACALLACSC